MTKPSDVSIDLWAIAIAEEVVDAKTPKEITDLIKSEFYEVFARGEARGIQRALNAVQLELLKLRDVH